MDIGGEWIGVEWIVSGDISLMCFGCTTIA